MVKLTAAVLAIATYTVRTVLAAPQGTSGASSSSPEFDAAETLDALRAMSYPGALEDPVLLDKLGLLLTAPEKVGHYMGDVGATETLEWFAKALGATAEKPGNLTVWNSVIFNKGFGIVPAPKGALPYRTVEKSRTKVPKAETVKIRYGPYKVPAASKKNMIGLYGMLSNLPHTNVERPCSGACTLLGMSAGLEYLDGTVANVNKGQWLHHLVLFAAGPNRIDYPCADRNISLPHVTVNSTARRSERIFASGNERTSAIFSDWGAGDAGYNLHEGDSLAMLVELMNMTPKDETVYITITYDFVQGHPFKDTIRAVWFDIRQCGTSEINPPQGKNQFVLDYHLAVPYEGDVVGAWGHLHDGGVKTQFLVDDKPVCDNTAKYGTTAEYISAAPQDGKDAAQGHSHRGPTKHISDMNVCPGRGLMRMKKGQTWKFRAEYDFDANPGMREKDGGWDEVMGIGMLYVRVKG